MTEERKLPPMEVINRILIYAMLEELIEAMEEDDDTVRTDDKMD